MLIECFYYNELTLTLFVTWIFFVDDIQFALATYNLAVGAPFLDGSSYFHGFYLYRKKIRPLVKS